MKTTNTLLSIIGALITVMVGLCGYFADKGFNELGQLRENQVRYMESQITIMERLGVARVDIDQAKEDIRDINKQINSPPR